MKNNNDSDQDTEEIEPDNESLELVLTESFQSWDEALNFFTEYCRQKGFSQYRKVVNVVVKLLKLLQV